MTGNARILQARPEAFLDQRTLDRFRFRPLAADFSLRKRRLTNSGAQELRRGGQGPGYLRRGFFGVNLLRFFAHKW